MSTLAVITDTFRNANYLEACLWFAIGLALLIRAALVRPRRGMCLLAGITLLAFGGSDLVEASTGAWWKPWWLLVWKGLCVLILIGLVAHYMLNRKRAS